MIRVFHLVKSLGRGGAEVLLSEGIRYSDPAKFVCGYGYFLPWKAAMVEGMQDQGVDVVCFNARGNAGVVLAARRVARHIERWNADVLHCHLPLAGIVGRMAGRLTDTPVVYTEHNKMERYHPLTRLLNLRTWRWQDRVVAVSKEVATSIEAHVANGSRVPVEVVLNGIDVERFRRRQIADPPIREELGIPVDSPVVGTVAVFRRQKALHDWIEAARLIHLDHPTVHFVLIGDGPLREELVQAARVAGLGEVLHFAGLRADVRPYLETMSLFMISSVFEGLPLALLEAMAMECAVVATSVGGIPEVVVSGENGALVEPESPASLAREANSLLASPERSKAFGQRARETIEAGFSMERMVRQLEEIYESVVDHQ